MRPRETSITGDKTQQRLADKPLLGARAFLYFWNNKEKIPEEWKGKLVFFDATTLRSPLGYRGSLYLCWYGDGWYWYCRRLDFDRYAPCVSACAS